MDELDFDLIDATNMFFSAIGTPNLKIRRKRPEELVPQKKDKKKSRWKRRGKGVVGADVVRTGIAGSECWSDTESEDDGDVSDTDTESDDGIDVESGGDSDSDRYYNHDDHDSDDDNWVKVKLPGQDEEGGAMINDLDSGFSPSRLRRTQGLTLIPRSKLAAIRAKFRADAAEVSSSYASTWSSEEDSDSKGDEVEGKGVAKTTGLGESVYHSVVLK
jgi:hypothetical protein